jgi:hypothetical protein
MSKSHFEINLLGIGCEGVNEMHLAAYRFQWWYFVKMWMNLPVPIPTATFLAANIFNVSRNILHNEVYFISPLVLHPSITRFL